MDEIMNIEYVKNHTIFETIVGSVAYGINTPESDIDKSGIMIPGREYYFGTKNFEQFQGYATDKVIYGINKAVKLIADNNPNMLDLLYTPERCIIHNTTYWKKIQDNAHLFLSKKTRYTYSGYAFSQLRRLKNHLEFIENPIEQVPKRSDYGLPEISVFPTAHLKHIVYTLTNYINDNEYGNFVAELENVFKNYTMPVFIKYFKDDNKTNNLEWIQKSVKSQGNILLQITEYVKPEFIDMAQKEIKYYNALTNYKSYIQWKKNRNKKRAELELKCGYDSKHGSHLIRLINMGVEILKYGKVNVDRTNIDKDMLLDIRQGNWTYEKLEKYFQEKENELTELYKSSKLQKVPQIVKIEELLIEIVDEYLFNNKDN